MHPRSLALVLGLASLAPSARAQERPTDAPAIAAPIAIRDGDRTWTAVRDPRDPRAVVVSAPGAPPFHARVDEHAIVRIAAGDPIAVMRALDLVLVREISRSLGAFRVRDARGEDGLALAARLAPQAGPGRPLVDAIPDWILMHRASAISIPPDDPRYSGQWYLDRIHIEDAWAMSTGDPSTTIVVVDSGCDMTHPDLAPSMDPGRDVLDSDDDPSPTAGQPGNEHGTACAGLVGAAGDNAIGIAGTCPECRIRCVRLLGGAATAVPLSADVEAFQFALDVDADVVSNSWGFSEPTSIPAMLRDVMLSVMASGRGGRGALVLFAAGNDDREIFSYEIEAVDGVITVGATNNFDEAAQFSNRGEPLDVVAPTGTLTTDISGSDGAGPDDYTSSFGGTSSSCPVAAGVAALLASAAPDRPGSELADALVSTAIQSPYATPDDRGHDALYGYGRIDPAAALRRVLGIPDPGPDAGTIAMDGGPSDAGTAPSPPSSGCSCRIIGRASKRSPVVLAAALALLVARRRGRRAAAGAGAGTGDGRVKVDREIPPPRG